MGGLGRPDKFLRSVYQHEQDIRGTEEELTYYSHNANEKYDETGLRKNGVFNVNERDDGVIKHNPKSEGFSTIHLVIPYTKEVKQFSRRSPVTINSLNIIAKMYGVKQYILYTETGEIISATFGSTSYDVIYMFELSVAIERFRKSGKVVPELLGIKKQSKLEYIQNEIKIARKLLDDAYNHLNNLEQHIIDGEFE
jgi:hypothetical protein